MQTAMYSAPAGSGLLYWTHSPALTMIACPALNLYYPEAPKKLYVQVREAK